jgi:hypothetical protein
MEGSLLSGPAGLNKGYHCQIDIGYTLQEVELPPPVPELAKFLETE